MRTTSGSRVFLAICIVILACAPGFADTTVLTLGDAAARALEGNPDLAAFSWDIRAAEAREIQARLRPNPELSVEVENIRLGSAPRVRTSTWSVGTTGVGLSRETEISDEDLEITLALSQVIELGGKRARRLELAARDRDVFAWDYEIARANVLRDVAQAYVSALAAQQRVALGNDLVELAQRVLDAVKARVEAGRVSPLEENKAATALASARVQAERSARELTATRTRLASLWGATEATFERVAGALENVHPLPDWEALDKTVEDSPDLKRWQAEIEKRHATLRVEKANRVPDIEVSAGFRMTRVPDSRTTGLGFGTDGVSYSQSRAQSDADWDDSVVVGVNVPLPLFNRNQGAIKEAEHLAGKAAEQRRSAHVTLHAALREAYEGAAGAYAAVLALRDGMLPLATQTFESFHEGYRQGKFGSLDVLDAQATLFELRSQYLDALTDYHAAATEVERLTGTEIPHIEPATTTEKDA